ncbi:MAG: hypothetical protein RLY78_1532 [Pseudomonadota bacterium]
MLRSLLLSAWLAFRPGAWSACARTTPSSCWTAPAAPRRPSVMRRPESPAPMSRPSPSATRSTCAWLLLPLLVSACASAPTLPSEPQPRRLPAAAAMPPRPEVCQPTCLTGWTRLVESLLPSPSGSKSP